MNVVLNPAAVTTEINVSGGELVVVDTSSARIGANVNEREVATLPLNGRQLSQLYLLVPGAQTAGGGSFDNIRFSGRSNQQNRHDAGRRRRSQEQGRQPGAVAPDRLVGSREQRPRVPGDEESDP